MATDTGRMQVKMEVDMTDIEVGILQTVWLQASRKALREPHASALEDFATPSEASLFLPRELTRNSCCDLEVPPPHHFKQTLSTDTQTQSHLELSRG